MKDASLVQLARTRDSKSLCWEFKSPTRHHIALLLILFLVSLSSADDFREPPCMKQAIDFWEKVYTVYDKGDAVFHDPETFEIYTVVRTHINPAMRRRQLKLVA